MRCKSSTSARGFALSELGIVVGLCIVTLAVLTSAVKQAKQDARARICLANQGMIVRGLSLYVDDEGVYPFSFKENYTNPTVNRYALGCLSRYVGGPATSVLEGKTEGQFPAVYICPSADKPTVFANNTNTMYNACYWVNMAVRVNMGFRSRTASSDWTPLLVDMVNVPGVPGSDVDSAGSARIVGNLCPQTASAHWRSLYHPRPDTVRVPGGMVFSGDTNNVLHHRGNGPVSYPGDWQMKPGYGWVETLLGFERHGDTIGVSYIDGHTRSFAHSEAEDPNSPRFYDGTPTGSTTGDWMVRYVGTDGCALGPMYRIHTLPAAVCN